MSTKILDLERMANDAQLSAEQIASIRLSKEKGRQIALDLPQIAEYYRNKMSLQEIAEKYNIAARYNITEGISVSAVYYALSGNRGEFGVATYDGLITDPSELRKIGLEHKANSGVRGYIYGLGIHALTSEERRENGRMGGQETYESKSGLHGLTHEEKMKAGHKGGLKSTVLRGQVPWIEEKINGLSEKDYVHKLSQLPEYQRGSKVNRALIARAVNERYHDNNPVRTRKSIQKSRLK